MYERVSAACECEGCECEGCECKGCVSEAVATDKEDTEVAEQGTSHHRMTSKKNVKAYFIHTQD